jgi:hypothetical protein
MKRKRNGYIFNAKGKWNYDELWLLKQRILFGEEASGVMMIKLWKWYLKFKCSVYKFKKLFLDDSNILMKIKELYYCVYFEKSEKLMKSFNSIETVCDNSYKLGEIRATATHINAGKLIRKNLKMFMNGNII